MGSFDGTEVCEVIGLYLLNKIKPVLGSNNVGLHRNDVLAIVHTVNAPKVDRLRQDTIGLFRDEGLSIASDTNLIEKDFLDRSLNLNRLDKNTFLLGNRIILIYIYTQNPTTHRQSSSNCHQ